MPLLLIGYVWLERFWGEWKKKWKIWEKIDRRGAWLEGGGKEKNVRAGYSTFGPTKTFTLPKLGRKWRRKGERVYWTKLSLSSNFFFVFWVFFFGFFYLHCLLVLAYDFLFFIFWGVLLSLFVLFFFLVFPLSFILILFSFSF